MRVPPAGLACNIHNESALGYLGARDDVEDTVTESAELRAARSSLLAARPTLPRKGSGTGDAPVATPADVVLTLSPVCNREEYCLCICVCCARPPACDRDGLGQSMSARAGVPPVWSRAARPAAASPLL